MDGSITSPRAVLLRTRRIAELPLMSDRRLMERVNALGPACTRGSYQEALIREAQRRGLVEVFGGC